MRKIPEFKNEGEKREFWATHDSTDCVDRSTAERAAFPNLKPSTKTISLRLPAWMLSELKALADQRGVPCPSLLKILLAEHLDQERAAKTSAIR